MSGYIEVNETAILMSGNHALATWWIGYRARADKTGRVEVLTSGIGDLLRIACEDADEAEWLAGRLIDKGVPKARVRANGPLPRGIYAPSGRARRMEGGAA
ncbi:hypothetical protein AB1484_27255 [Parafrankia sp. FMc6]|uniref:hypothetical protein n=1 Tax=Parafrankia soli TaxID=2599596 RepID=UPI0034D49657